MAARRQSVGNSIGSLRFLDSTDWREFVETQSVVEQILRTDPAKIYSLMDFTTRDLYRHSIERIARQSKKTESEVATLAINLAQASPCPPDVHVTHVGFYLTGKGQDVLEKSAEMRTSIRGRFSRFAQKFPLVFYLGGIWLLALAATVKPFVHALRCRWKFLDGWSVCWRCWRSSATVNWRFHL